VTITILQGDVVEQLRTLPDCSVQCVVTSPPYYGLRDYGIDGQIGMEETPELFVSKIVEVFREVKRVLRDDGTLWLNFGDSYNGSGGSGGDYADGGLREGQPKVYGNKVATLKPKDMIGIPWMVAFALRADGWYLRSDIIWSKPNPMPESVTDRPTKAHEYIFLLTKSARYYYDADAIREEPEQTPKADINGYGGVGFTDHKNDLTMGMSQFKQTPRVTHPAGRNRRTVWEIATQPTPEAHFATFPEALVEPCIKAGTSERGCCAVCGAPMERITNNQLVPTKKAAKTFVYDDRDTTGHEQNDQGSNRARDGHKSGYITAVNTLGWQPTCTCNADTVPCVVLDPFGGSGTTAKVARDLKRDCTLIELNPAYIKIAKNKLRLNEQLVF